MGHAPKEKQHAEVMGSMVEAREEALAAVLREAYEYYMGPHACGDFTCACNKPEQCGICDLRKRTEAVLALPLARPTLTAEDVRGFIDVNYSADFVADYFNAVIAAKAGGK